MTNHQKLAPDDVQVLENVLDDSGAGHLSRRALLGLAAGGAAAVAFPGMARAVTTADTPMTVGTTAVTAEALAVTYLTNLIQKTGAKFPTKVQNVLKAANAAEEAHFGALKSLGFKPLTTKFWIPDVAFSAQAAPTVIEYFEQGFVNAYLIGTTVFANKAQAKYARYTVEIGAVEAEHLALARSVQGKLPDDRAFQAYDVQSIDQIVQAIVATGVGIGKQGAQPGAFYTYASPPSSAVVALEGTSPS